MHNLYKPLVNSGLAFGAKRWVGTLDRQCERLASVMASNIASGDIGGIIPCPEISSLKLIQVPNIKKFCHLHVFGFVD